MKSKENQLRVWWSSQVPITKGKTEFYLVSCIDEAKLKLSILAKRDLENPFVTDNIGGLEIFQDGKFCEWQDEFGDDIWEVMKNE